MILHEIIKLFTANHAHINEIVKTCINKSLILCITHEKIKNSTYNLF